MSDSFKLSAYDLSHIDSLSDPQISLDGKFATYLKKSDGISLVVWEDLENPGNKVQHRVPVKSAHPFGGGVTQLSRDGQRLYCVTSSGGIALLVLATGELADIYPGPGVSQISLSLDESRIAAVILGDRVAMFDPFEKSDPVVVSELPRVLRPFGGLPEEPGYFVAERPDFIFDVSLNPDGTRLAWHEWALPYMPWQRSQISFLDIKSRDHGPEIIVCAGGDYRVAQPRFSPDGVRLAFLAEDPSFLRLWTANLADWSAERAVSEDLELAGATWGNGNRTFDFSNDGKRIYFSRNEAGHGRLLEVDLQTRATLGVAKAHHFGVKSSKSSVIALRSGAKTPNVIVTYDLQTGDRKEIGRAYTEKFYSAVLAEPELGIAPYSTLLHDHIEPAHRVQLELVEQLDVPYRLYRPESDKEDLPTVVTFHGGPTDQSLVTYSSRNVAFMQAGYQVLNFDYRGSTGWGRSFREKLDSGFGVVEIIDLLTVLSDLVSRGLAKPGSVVANGGSSGGYSALRSVCLTRGLFCGAIAAYPLIDLADSAASTHRFESRYFDSLVGTLPDRIRLYRDRSVKAEMLDDIPLLLMHGDSDPVVNHRQAVRFADEARALGRSVEFMLFPGEGHGFSSPETLEAEFDAYEKFLAGLRGKGGF
ncbi:MAG: S9 family peptidase [Actinomycetota bacterium]|nr:MAG: S9 family peptidase [Actinomycetota bacterium]